MLRARSAAAGEEVRVSQVETPVEVEEEVPKVRLRRPPEPEPPEAPEEPWPAWFDDMPRD